MGGRVFYSQSIEDYDLYILALQDLPGYANGGKSHVCATAGKTFPLKTRDPISSNQETWQT